MSGPKHPEPNSESWDEVFLQSRRELWGVLLIWVLFAVWVIGGSALLGFRELEGEVRLVWGMPAWVFWAIGVPWFVSNIVIGWFCLRVMKDQSLESDENETALDKDGSVAGKSEA